MPVPRQFLLMHSGPHNGFPNLCGSIGVLLCGIRFPLYGVRCAVMHGHGQPYGPHALLLLASALRLQLATVTTAAMAGAAATEVVLAEVAANR
eukprot:CAMPEP_0168403758 /NCGR_PEP_ID=MMETSP0228-20121227/24292_1 /TAXON_ID=133427 /ORGANISM="Protoceratium reticulatum, Strain CCCM 535 (=CCMP 1889)" /LENGTH=92 /DNA_ID=CAMNT_0008417367 /DNA_START=122 /DNA_END=397 /DNA_ORIENTATION=-